MLGADELGRDIWSRLVYGARTTLTIVALVALTAPVFGLLVGTAAGYLGGWTDRVLMRITDIFMAFPRLILALAFVAAPLGISRSSGSPMTSILRRSGTSKTPGTRWPSVV